jgi:diadenosine tetraphosphate (Ap4A) HIT family hydrolase
MTKEERQALMPVVKEFVEAMRAEFGEGVKVTYCAETGPDGVRREYGRPLDLSQR